MYKLGLFIDSLCVQRSRRTYIVTASLLSMNCFFNITEEVPVALWLTSRTATS